MAIAPGGSENVCYRHPDRQSFVTCQRCSRTICPACQTQAAVGVHCPECVREARGSAPRSALPVAARLRSLSDQPVVTWGIIAVCVVVYVLQLLPGSAVTQDLLYYPPYTLTEPWRMITAIFVHSQTSFLHILLNMVSLYLFGPIVERLLGRVRYLALYLLSGLGGSVAVLLIAPDTPVVGASGAIFGLLGAFFVIARRLGGNSSQILIVIVINLGIGFLPGTNIAWQAHLGGLVTGAAVALVFLLTRRTSQKTVQIVGVLGIFVALIGLTILGVRLL